MKVTPWAQPRNCVPEAVTRPKHVDLNLKSTLRNFFFYPLFKLMVLCIHLKHFKHWLLYITYLDIKYFNEIKYTQLLLIICYLEA